MGAAPRVAEPSTARGAGGRPVLLATIGVPFDADAAAFAVDAAVESASPLIVANVVELEPLAMSINMRYEQLEDEPDLAAALRFPAELASSLGVEVERVRIRSLRPLEALLEFVTERQPGLLVFGPERPLLRRRTYTKAARRIRERATCLVWIADDA